MKTTVICLAFALTITTAALAAAIDEHTVGLWLFDEGSGTEIMDLTDNNNDGEFQGELAWTNGKFGSALEFDGNGSVIVPNSESLNVPEQITIEAWVTVSDAGVGLDTVAARIEPAYSLQKFSNDQMEGWVNIDGGWQGVRDLPGDIFMVPNVWYHVALVYDGESLKVYMDGVLDRENAISGNINVVEEPFTIGSYKGESYYWLGKIDEVRVSSIARTQDEIIDSMSGFSGTTAVAPGGKLTSTWAQIKI